MGGSNILLGFWQALSSKTSPEFASWIFATAFAAVGSGAMFVINNCIYRRRAKIADIKQRVTKTESLIREYEKNACLYWATHHNETDANKLKADIKRLRSMIGMEVTTLIRTRDRCEKCAELVKPLHSIATGESFESPSDFQPDPSRENDISSKANELICCLRKTCDII